MCMQNHISEYACQNMHVETSEYACQNMHVRICMSEYACLDRPHEVHCACMCVCVRERESGDISKDEEHSTYKYTCINFSYDNMHV